MKRNAIPRLPAVFTRSLRTKAKPPPPSPPSHQQHRGKQKPQKRPVYPKAFIPKIDKIGDTYYVLGHHHVPADGGPPRWSRTRRELRPRDIFQLSPLVIDLDARVAKGVRPFNHDDHERLNREWGREPKREFVRKRIAELQDHLNRGRTAMEDISGSRLHPARINHHDILSAALRGAPVDEPTQGEGEPIESRQGLDMACGPAHSKVLSEANMIPTHALKSDTLFLRWMTLRQGQGVYLHETTTEDSIDEILTTLGDKVEDLFCLRRLLFDTVDDIAKFHTQQEPPKSSATALADVISRALRRILQHREHEPAVCFEALAMVHNLIQRIERHEPVEGFGPFEASVSWLWGLAGVQEPEPWAGPVDVPTPLEDTEGTFEEAVKLMIQAQAEAEARKDAAERKRRLRKERERQQR